MSGVLLGGGRKGQAAAGKIRAGRGRETETGTIAAAERFQLLQGDSDGIFPQ